VADAETALLCAEEDLGGGENVEVRAVERTGEEFP